MWARLRDVNRRRAIGTLAVVVLVVLAMPVGGSSHTSEAVVSVHDTTADFDAGTTTDGLDTSGDTVSFVQLNTSETFADAGATETWTAPANGTVTLALWGPGGGDGGGATTDNAGSGGPGGYVEVAYDVTKGETLTIVPGAAGQDGQDGFDGGDPGAGGSGLYDGGDGAEGRHNNGEHGGGGGGGGGDSGVLDGDGDQIASAGGGGGGGGAADDPDNAGGGGGGGGAQGGLGGDNGMSGSGDIADDGGGPGSHGGNGGDGSDEDYYGDTGHDGGNGAYVVNQGTQLDGSVGGGNAGDGQISLDFVGDAGQDETYTSANHSVSNAVSGFTDFAQLENVSATVTWEAYNGTGWDAVASSTYTTPGNHTQSFAAASADAYRVDVQFTSTGKDPAAVLTAEGVTATTHAPTITNASPTGGTFVNDRPVALNVTLEDTDFGTGQGDEVTVEFFDGDGTLMDTDTVTENGTATGEYDNLLGGDNAWYAVATDDYGNTARSPASGNHTFETVGEIEIRSERNNELLDSGTSEVTVRFYQEGEDTVHVRTTNSGIIDMAGLPVGEELIANAQSDGYLDRRVVIDSLFEQQTIYLLDENADSVQVDFVLDDRTREFPAESTKLRVLGAINNGSDDGTYEVVAGDYFGATGSFPVHLIRENRYRLEIENRDGDVRVLGTFTPVASREEVLSIGSIVIETQVDGDYVFDAGTTEIDDYPSDKQLRISYVDYGGETSSLSWELRNELNTSAVYDTGSATWTPDGETQHYEAILQNGTDYPADERLEIAYTIERDGETIERTLPVGGLAAYDWPINAWWLQMLGLFVIVGTAALFGGTLSRIGAVVVVIVAFGLTMIGVLTIPAPILGLALVGAVMFKVAAGRFA